MRAGWLPVGWGRRAADRWCRRVRRECLGSGGACVLGVGAVAAVLGAAVLGAAAWRTAGVRFNTSASLPRGLYRLVGPAGPVRRGELVLACPPAPMAALARARGYLPRGSCPGGVQALGKMIAAVGGDLVEVSAAGLKVNGVPLTESGALAADARGRPLPRWPAGRYRVRPGKVWLYAPHRRSLDSRYFGPVAAGKVIGRLTPLATAGGAAPLKLAARLRCVGTPTPPLVTKGGARPSPGMDGPGRVAAAPGPLPTIPFATLSWIRGAALDAYFFAWTLLCCNAGTQKVLAKSLGVLVHDSVNVG